MNISFVHIFEIITLLLIVGKLFQVRKLYQQSNSSLNTNHMAPSRNNKLKKSSTRVSGVLQETALYKKFKENYSQHNLPLPEVSFSSSDTYGHFSKPKVQSKHKVILNNYIEDFFFESSPKVFHEAKVVEFKNYKLDSNAEDEFITVADEHAEIVRAFESLQKNICLVR